MTNNTKSMLPILGIETSGNLCSVAAYINKDIYSECSVNKKNIHSEILFDLVENCLTEIELSIENIKSLAISEGPGSFTGLRIGMAAAKGIADGAGIPIVSVPTFEALALEISNYIGLGEKFCIINKASRDEYYFASYIKSSDGILAEEELKILDSEGISSLSKGIQKIYGNYKSESEFELSSPSALSVARWAYFYGKDLLNYDYDYLEPNYLKNFKVKKNK